MASGGLDTLRPLVDARFLALDEHERAALSRLETATLKRARDRQKTHAPAL